MQPTFSPEKLKENSIPIYPVITDQLEKWSAKQSSHIQQWIKTSQFSAESGASCFIPNSDGGVQAVLLGLNNTKDFLAFGALPAKLPKGVYHIADKKIDAKLGAVGWGLGFYQFSQYKVEVPRLADLALSKQVDADSLENFLESIYLARDLINTF